MRQVCFKMRNAEGLSPCIITFVIAIIGPAVWLKLNATIITDVRTLFGLVNLSSENHAKTYMTMVPTLEIRC